MKRMADNRNGFTLVELVIVILMLGVMSAFLVAKFYDTSAVNLNSEADVFKSHLRYAQSRAMNTNSVWGINISSANQYSLFQSSTTNIIRLPGQETSTVTLPNGLTFSNTGIVAFDTWGKPYTAAVCNAGSAQSGDRPIVLNLGGSSKTIFITPNTGFIQ